MNIIGTIIKAGMYSPGRPNSITEQPHMLKIAAAV